MEYTFQLPLVEKKQIAPPQTLLAKPMLRSKTQRNVIVLQNHSVYSFFRAIDFKF